MRNLFLALLLAAFLLSCSGCATILGGIIGYQSGELGAGLAIGAAFDFGGDIATGIGQAFGDEKKAFLEKATLDSDKGEITLPRSAFSKKDIEKLMLRLKQKLEANKWSCIMSQKKTSSGTTLLSEKWKCRTAEGVDFDMAVLYEKCEDPKITIETSEGNAGQRGEITIKVYEMIRDTVGACP